MFIYVVFILTSCLIMGCFGQGRSNSFQVENEISNNTRKLDSVYAIYKRLMDEEFLGNLYIDKDMMKIDSLQIGIPTKDVFRLMGNPFEIKKEESSGSIDYYYKDCWLSSRPTGRIGLNFVFCVSKRMSTPTGLRCGMQKKDVERIFPTLNKQRDTGILNIYAEESYAGMQLVFEKGILTVIILFYST